MWVKIQTVSSNHATIYLPESLKAECGAQTLVAFGQKAVPADIEYVKDLDGEQESSYDRPALILMTEKLKSALCVPETPTFRLLPSSSRIALGPVIGLLLGNKTRRYTPRHMTKYSDRLGVYPRVGGLICAFSPKWIHWRSGTVSGLYYNMDLAAWVRGRFPLPDVIYRRDFHTSPKGIKRLCVLTGDRLFNSYRFTKYELYRFISQSDELKAFLPATALLTGFAQCRAFLDRYASAIVKPVDLSRGRGICVIECKGSGYRVADYRTREPQLLTLRGEEALRDFFEGDPDFYTKYIIQQYLPLARIDGCNFDIRVVMQKMPDKTWSRTGAECRVSKGESHLTNISRGGAALTLGDALSQAFDGDAPGIEHKISDFCVRFCRYMDTMPAHFAEFGIDLAVDTAQNLWLIEANVFPSFKGIKKIDPAAYLNIRYAPLLYALSLTPFGEGKP